MGSIRFLSTFSGAFMLVELGSMKARGQVRMLDATGRGNVREYILPDHCLS
jgi:hypothetical protein